MGGNTIEDYRPIHVPAAYGEPPNGWSWARLDKVTVGVFDCPHSTPKLTESGPYVVRTQDILTGVFRTEQASHVSEETYAERISRVTPSRGDLLYSREGTYFGIAAEVPEQTRVCLGQRMVLIRPQPEVLDFSFLRYWLNSPFMAAHIHGYRDGSVAERLNLPTIRALPVLLPPLPEQKAIASVLGALDDKIELNRRMNATLEAMARALFQSWFVDFDPVRAKLDGRQPPNLDPATAALFPDSFQDSELGQIPRGWEVAHLEDISTVGSGKRPEGRFDVLSPECKVPLYGGGGRMGYVLSALYDKPILFTGRVGTLGLIFRTAEPSWPSDNTLIVEPQTGYFDFTYFIMKGYNLFALNRGSTQPLLTQTDLKRQTLVLPTKDVVEAFADFSAPIFCQIVSNESESRTLADLRDTLLPKLLSGELSISESSAIQDSITSLPQL